MQFRIFSFCFCFCFLFSLTLLCILEFQSRQSFEVLVTSRSLVIWRKKLSKGEAMLVLAVIISLLGSHLITKSAVEAKAKTYIIETEDSGEGKMSLILYKINQEL